MNYSHILPLSTIAAVILISPSHAATIQGHNKTTGESSRNTIDITLDTTVIDQTTTTINSDNTFTFNLETGNNRANSNTEDGTTKSGSIAVDLVNTNQPAPATTTTVTHNSMVGSGATADVNGQGSVIISDDPVTVVTENSNTGANSTNTADVSKASTVTVSKTTTLTETNDFALNLRTGNNAADFNTGSGLVESGNISVFVKKETLPTPQPEKPKPAPAPAPAAPPTAQPAVPAPQPTVIPTPIQELKPLIAEKLAELVPSQPTQFAITPAAQPAQAAPAAQAPAAKLPRAGAELPLVATLLSATTLKAGRYLRKRHRDLLYRTKKPW